MKRIYKVETVVKVEDGIHKNTRLIKATTRAQACKTGMGAIVTAIVASQDDLVRLTEDGVKVEEVGNE
jgi:hypothetical protein